MNRLRWAAMVAASLAVSSCGFHHAKYDNPITKDTQQPDKLLYDKSIKDLEKGRYETARLTLNTLINTYDSSEYLAKAKLAIADSWYREGGVSAMAQAEANYKDFELFYPTMPEAAESQYKICMIHYNEMEKPDRDSKEALRAENECKALVTSYPNSKFVPQTLQLLRNIDEAMAEGEMRVGDFYYKKGSRASAANRYFGLVQQYPLYSRADEALWKEADAYLGMGQRMRPRAIQAYQELVREYPLSEYADGAKRKLREMEAEVPEPDPQAVARMKYEDENRKTPGLFHRATEFMRPSPDISMAAKIGTPAMNAPKQNIPVDVPLPQGSGQTGFVGDVTVSSANGPAGISSTNVAPAATATSGKTAEASTTTVSPAATAVTNPAPSQAATDANSKNNGKKKNAKKSKKNQKQDQSASPDQSQAPAAKP